MPELRNALAMGGPTMTRLGLERIKRRKITRVPWNKAIEQTKFESAALFHVQHAYAPQYQYDELADQPNPHATRQRINEAESCRFWPLEVDKALAPMT